MHDNHEPTKVDTQSISNTPKDDKSQSGCYQQLPGGNRNYNGSNTTIGFSMNRYILDMPCIEKDDLKIFRQDIKHRLPVNTSALHRNMSTLMRFAPSS